MKYRVIANGIDMGLYSAASKKQALDEYSKDAGYMSYDDMIVQIPHLSDDHIEVVSQFDTIKDFQQMKKWEQWNNTPVKQARPELFGEIR